MGITTSKLATTAIRPPIIHFSSLTDAQLTEIMLKMLSERHRYLDATQLLRLSDQAYQRRYRLNYDLATATRADRERVIAHLAMLGVPVPRFAWFHCTYARHPEPRREADVCALDEQQAIAKAEMIFGGLWSTYITAQSIN